MAPCKQHRRLRFRLSTLLVLVSLVMVGIAVYHQLGRGPFAEYRAKRWVLDIGGTITYTYHGDTQRVHVTIPSQSSGGSSYDLPEVLCVRAIRDLAGLSLWGQELDLSGEDADRLKGDKFQVGWERLERIIDDIEGLAA